MAEKRERGKQEETVTRERLVELLNEDLARSPHAPHPRAPRRAPQHG